MGRDAMVAAEAFEFFTGLVTEVKGGSIPMGPDAKRIASEEVFGPVLSVLC